MAQSIMMPPAAAILRILMVLCAVGPMLPGSRANMGTCGGLGQGVCPDGQFADAASQPTPSGICTPCGAAGQQPCPGV